MRCALELFYEKGFHGTSVRDIAGRADIGIATLFHHAKSKASILERLLNNIVDDLQAELDRAMRDVRDPLEGLAVAVRVLVDVHIRDRPASFVAQSELRSLDPDPKVKILHKRSRVQNVFVETITAAREKYGLDCDPKESARAIVSMIVMIATWYREGAGMTPTQVADTYVAIALRIVGAEGWTSSVMKDALHDPRRST